MLIWGKWVKNNDNNNRWCVYLVKKTCPHNIGPSHLAEPIFCDECVQDKQHQKTFSKDEALNVNKLGLLHTNVWGLAKTPSFGATRYLYFSQIIFFTNHLSTFWRTKESAFQNSKIFKPSSKTKLEKKPRF